VGGKSSNEKLKNTRKTTSKKQKNFLGKYDAPKSSERFDSYQESLLYNIFQSFKTDSN